MATLIKERPLPHGLTGEFALLEAIVRRARVDARAGLSEAAYWLQFQEIPLQLPAVKCKPVDAGHGDRRAR
jgi:hypothetical protein